MSTPSTPPAADKFAGKTHITKKDIKGGFERLGIKRGDVLLSHSSLSRFGFVEGGPDAVIDAILETLGPEGTIIMSAITTNWGIIGAAIDAADKGILAPIEPFDVANKKCWAGTIAETFRKRPGVKRSWHPTHSVSAFGARADEMIANHENAPGPCGEGTPYARVCDVARGFILLLGVSHQSNTAMHGMEELAGVEYVLYPKWARLPIITPEGPREARTRVHNSYMERNLGILETDYINGLAETVTHIGDSYVRLVNAKKMRDITVPALQKKPLMMLTEQGLKVWNKMKETGVYNRNPIPPTTQMKQLDWANLAETHKTELLESVMPFWLKHSMDPECGGYLHHLDRDGSIFCTDKMMWMQGREVYMFARLYNEVEKRPEWLEAAKLGADFLRKFGRDENGAFYFLLDRKGNPLRVAYNIYSDFFVVMAMLEYAKASKESWALDLAVETFWKIMARRDNPKGRYNKVLPRPGLPSDHTFPMILLNVSGMMLESVKDDRIEDLLRDCLNRIMTMHVDEKRKAVFEFVWADGSRPDEPAGRFINPGHAIESMWFVMEAANKRGMKDLVDKAAEAMLWTAERGWDEEFGGLYYFMDFNDRPVEALEWNMKLWWPHTEALIGFMLAHEITGRIEFANWYRRFHEYTFKIFPDPGFGEWVAYCDRRGVPTHFLKGSKWKCCFHVPRALLNCWQISERMKGKSA